MRPLLGLFVWEFASAGMWPILASTGLDFAVVDLEHSGFSHRETASLLAGARSTSLPALVRVPETGRPSVSRVLDLGADGVIAPRIATREDAEALVRYSKYAPTGDRGIAFGCAHDAYGAETQPLKRFVEIANAGVVCIAMIETVGGVEAANDICTTPGISCVWIGHADLSHSLGDPGNYSSPAFREAETSVLETAGRLGMPVGVLVPSARSAVEKLQRGYRLIAIGTEVSVLQRSIAETVGHVRSRCNG